MKNRKLLVFAAVVLTSVGAGFALASFYYQKREKALFSQVAPYREKDSKYKFINPLLTYELPESKEFNEYKPLESKLTNLISSFKINGRASDVSVYFRGDKGRWVGINENDTYNPASLLKVVVMISYFKEAQSVPSLLHTEQKFTNDIARQVTNNEFNAPSQLKVGTLYTVEELIQKMIIDSDNGATFTLLNNIDSNALEEVYTDLGISKPDDKGVYTISAKSYSLFFRILYNATYLNREMSEKALKLLSETTFKDGLVAGVPEGTGVAHKFGEHTQDVVELHDCGLVYPKQGGSYLLCVMTRGGDVNDLENIIKDISQVVYSEIVPKN